MTQPAITVEGLGKSYRIGLAAEQHDTFRDLLTGALAAPFRRLRSLGEHGDNGRDVFWALKDVDFEVNPGEVVGIIGRNGAGKSTLLKILSSITEPTTGRVKIRGRVASLLEIGTGFHPELTGRENIYLNGAILGMTRDEIRRKFDQIVDFSGVERFLDTPIKRYSSGMAVRLGFAVAAHLEPEILIVDEVLAVGDAEFQRKCLGKMKDVAGQGRTVLFVSHNMGAIQALCSRAILLRQGLLAMDDDVSQVIRNYLSYLVESGSRAFADNPERSGNSKVRLTSARILDCGGTPDVIVAGRPATIEFEYVNRSGQTRVEVVITIFNQMGAAVSNLNTHVTGTTIEQLGRRGVIRCNIPRLPLLTGRYRIAAALKIGRDTADLIPNALVFDVGSTDFYPTGREPDAQYCCCLIEHSWSHVAIQQEDDSHAGVSETNDQNETRARIS